MSRQIPVLTGSSRQPTTGNRVLKAPKPTDVALGAYEVGDLFYNGFNLTADLLGIVTDIQIERSIEEATTVTITARDRARLLLKSGALDERANLDIGEHLFRLVHVNKTGDDFTLTFEDRDVARLRGVTKPRKVSRNKVTRAEFAKMLVDETPGIDFFCPDLHVKQQVDAAATPIGTAPADPTPAQLSKGAKTKGLGFPPGVSLTIGGSPASAHQLAEAARLLSVANQLNASPLPTLAMIFAAIAESKIGGIGGTYTPNGSGYWGVLQGGSGTHGSAANFPNPHDTEAFARAFLLGGKGFNQGGGIALSKTVKDPVEIAVKVETPSIWPNNAYAGEAGYSNFLPEARKIIEAYTGQPLDASLGGDTTGGNDPAYATPTVTTIAKPYEFTRGLPEAQPGDPPENTWDCLKRLADKVQRRRFLIDRTVTFAFEKDLLKQPPVMTISETDEGIDWIDFDRDEGKHVESATVTCRAEAWAAPPGSVVVVEDLGDASGRWLVSRISGSLFLPGRSIELTRGLKALREPAHETITKTTDANPADISNLSPTSLAPPNGGTGSGRYVNPFGNDCNTDRGAGRTDEGVDPTVTEGGHLLAIGNAKIVAVNNVVFYAPAPAYMVYQLLDGPRAGQYIYYSEYIKPIVHTGQMVKAGQTIAYGQGRAIEIGFAGGPKGSYLPLANHAQGGHYAGGGVNDDGSVPKQGLEFRRFLGELGAKGYGGPSSQPFGGNRSP